MTITPNRLVPDGGLVEIQQTAELRAAVGAPLVLGDDATWINISAFVQKFMAGTPAARGVVDERNVSSSNAMRSRSKVVPAWTPSMTVFYTNGVASDVGLTADVDLRTHFFAPAAEQDLSLPVRYSIRGESGDNLLTYSLAKVTQCTVPDLDSSATTSAMYTVQFDSEDCVISTIA